VHTPVGAGSDCCSGEHGALEARFRDLLRLGRSEQILRPSQRPLPAPELLRLQQIEAGVEELVRQLKARVGAGVRRKRPRTPEGVMLKYPAWERVHLFAPPAIHDEQGHLVTIMERTDNAPVFPSARGGFLSADALQRLGARHVVAAGEASSSLAGGSITPHTLRHTTATALLRRAESTRP
jgi:integrase